MPRTDQQTDRPFVLVADDDEDTRAMICEILEGEGFQALGAANGAEALSLLRSCLRAGEHLPDLVLLDILMPVVNGWRFLLERREDARLRKIPVVLLSGLQTPQAAAWEIAGHFKKPLDLEELISTVRKLTSH